MNSKTFKLSKTMTPLLLLGGFLLSAPVSAQDYGSSNSGDYVTVYQDCDYRGAARNIPVGDFPDMRSIQMKNDSISSFRVPQGLQLTLYQDDRYGGFSGTFDREVRCLDKGWNDQASALKVNWAGAGSSQSGGDYRNGGGDYRNDRTSADNRYQGDARNNNFYTDRKVDGNNVSRVEFGGAVLEKIGAKRWQLARSAGQSTTYREQSKNANTLYLQGMGNQERLRVDLFSKDVTVMSNRGQSTSYALSRALRANENYAGGDRRNDRVDLGSASDRGDSRTNPVASTREKGDVRGKCFDYRAWSNGGDAGLRFHTGDKDFKRFTKKPISGRICHRGSLVLELTKTAPSTAVTVEIQGVKYRFARDAEYDTLLNNWYRKSVTLNVRG